MSYVGEFASRDLTVSGDRLEQKALEDSHHNVQLTCNLVEHSPETRTISRWIPKRPNQPN